MVHALAALFLCSCQDFILRREEPEVVPPTMAVETFVQAAEPKVDLLWAIADSASMEQEQERLSASLGTFVDTLSTLGVAWQLGVVTTSLGEPDVLGVLRGDPWILTPDDPTPTATFRAMAAVGTAGTGAEAGLAAVLAALDASSPEGMNRGFRRQDATLRVLVLSDDDDESDAYLGEDAVLAVTSRLEREGQDTGIEATLTAIVGDLPAGCTSTDGVSARPAPRYREAAEQSGGTTPSLCSADFADVLIDLALGAAVYARTFPLQAEPVPQSVRVDIDGQRQADGWQLVAGPAIEFDEPPPASSTIVVRYEIAESAP